MKITNGLVTSNRLRVKHLAFAAALGLLPLVGHAAELAPGPVAGNTVHLDNVRDYAFCEFWLVMGARPDLTLQIYNTSGQGQCTPAEFDPVNAEVLAKRLGVDAVVKNPPRHWLMDQLWTYDSGQTYDFDGVKATWMAFVPLKPGELGKHGEPTTSYTISETHRRSKYLWQKGSEVYLLRRPDGKVFIMQSYTNLVDKGLTQADLPKLAGKLSLPPGWTYEVKTLDREFTLIPEASRGYEAWALSDDLQNVYQGCGFDKSCSYIP